MKLTQRQILAQQKAEITEARIYENLAKKSKDKKNRKILRELAKEERGHYKFLKRITKQEVLPSKFRIFFYIFIANFFGLSFALRLMEKGEGHAQNVYAELSKKYSEAKKIKEDEIAHEQYLISILNDEKLNYAGAIVLGLNDALVELTGTLAGLSFAFSNNLVIGMTGVIMGIAASLSMAASGYLSSKEDGREDENPIKSAIYTGVAYIITVVFLVAPYFIFSETYMALITMLIITIIIIALYTYYISIAKNIEFKKRFFGMALISLGVAVISFLIGYFVKNYFGIEI